MAGKPAGYFQKSCERNESRYTLSLIGKGHPEYADLELHIQSCIAAPPPFLLPVALRCLAAAWLCVWLSRVPACSTPKLATSFLCVPRPVRQYVTRLSFFYKSLICL